LKDKAILIFKVTEVLMSEKKFFPKFPLCITSRKKNGFTFIELMIAVAIAGIVASLAMNGLSGLIPDYKAKSAARELRVNIQKAKMEAVKNNRESLVEFTYTGGGSSGSAFGCFDTNSDNSCKPADDEMIFSFSLDGTSGVKLINDNFGSSVFSFNSRGLPDVGASSKVKFSNDSGYEIFLEVMPGGRVKIN
jgi:type IV fimbrial biogenesis protein FimT